MAEPTPITDALAIIDGDPVLSAVATLTVGGCLEASGGRAPAEPMRAAALAIVASRAPAHPDPYTLAELDALDAAATRVQLAVQALRYARKVREDASLRTFDAAEAAVQAAARTLAAALGGAR